MTCDVCGPYSAVQKGFLPNLAHQQPSIMVPSFILAIGREAVQGGARCTATRSFILFLTGPTNRFFVVALFVHSSEMVRGGKYEGLSFIHPQRQRDFLLSP